MLPPTFVFFLIFYNFTIIDKNTIINCKIMKEVFNIFNKDEQLTLFEELGSYNYEEEIECFLIGGNVLVHIGIKEATKDFDFVFNDIDKRNYFAQVLIENGFELYGALKNEKPVTLQRNGVTIDLFFRVTTHCILSKDMQERAIEKIKNGHLNIFVTDPQDILLLKSATDRVDDIEIGKKIIDRVRVQWNNLIIEAKNQEEYCKDRVFFDLFDYLLKIETVYPDSVPINVIEEFKLLSEKKLEALYYRLLTKVSNK
jgi:hypothetical protein